MIREPAYSDQAINALDSVEVSGDQRMWNAVLDVIDLICDHSESAEARREQLRGKDGTVVWKVPVRTDDDWVVLWWPDGDLAYIPYIGVL